MSKIPSYTKKFKGKIAGENIYEVIDISKLDYNIKNYSGRLELVDRLIEENNVEQWLSEYNDDYYNPVLGATNEMSIGGQLSELDNVNQQIEKLANYLLYSSDVRNTNEIKSEKQLHRINSKETSMGLSSNVTINAQDMVEISSRTKINEEGRAETFKGNFKLEKKQRILDEDFIKFPALKEYDDFIKVIRNKENIGSYKKMKLMNFLRQDMIALKDSLAGTIYFKHLLPEIKVFDGNYIDLRNAKQINYLLRISGGNLGTWYGHAKKALNEIVKSMKLTKRQQEILEIVKDSSYKTDKERADELGITKQGFAKLSNNLVNKIVTAYENDYELWMYENYFSLKRKKCVSCGEELLINEFSLVEDGIYGVDYICNSCKVIKQTKTDELKIQRKKMEELVNDRVSKKR